jgi:predicted small integral membrane protein
MTPGKIARHVVLFAVILLVLTAVAIWLDLGPVVHSRSPVLTADTR